VVALAEDKPERSVHPERSLHKDHALHHHRPPQPDAMMVNGSLFGLRGRLVDVPGYSGPLELLLKLIRKNEVDIYDIPIAMITDQYLVELESMERGNLTVAGDFLLMAATLLEIKSAMMLPRPALREDSGEEVDPRAELAQRLLEYQAFQELAEQLGRLEQQRRMLYSRPFMPSVYKEFGPARPPAPNLNLESLCESLKAMLERLSAEGEPITSIPREQIPLRLRIAEVLSDLKTAGAAGIPLEDLIRPQKGRLFIIVTFLALLELLRSGRIRVQDDRAHGTHRFWPTRGETPSHD